MKLIPGKAQSQGLIGSALIPRWPQRSDGRYLGWQFAQSPCLYHCPDDKGSSRGESRLVDDFWHHRSVPEVDKEAKVSMALRFANLKQNSLVLNLRCGWSGSETYDCGKAVQHQ